MLQRICVMTELCFDGGVVRLHGREHLAVDSRGACRIIDGDTIMIGGQRMRIYGIDAPAVRGSRGAPHCPEQAKVRVPRSSARIRSAIVR